MAVGTIANISISAYPTYINVSFAKPANTTKFLVVLVDPNTGYTFYSNYFSSSNATGNTVTCKVTGVIAGHSYIVYVTPYNGTTAGTQKQYINSGTTNLVKVPSSTTSSQAGTSSGTSSSTTSTVGNGSINPTSPTGSTANGGSSGTSSAAPSNTPVFNPGSVSTSPPSDINSSARISQKVEGLDPNTPYSIDIRAVTTDASGNTIYSEWSPKLNLITPGYSTDGNNFQSVNNATDIQLSGGSIFAGTFDVSTGIIDVVNDTVNGSGVILNKTGLLAVNSGTKEFYLDAVTGNAYFAGVIASSAIKSTNYAPTSLTDGSAYSTAGTYINLNDGSITSKNFRIQSDGNAFFKGDVSASTINGSGIVSYVNSTATTVAQTAANGKNKIYYGFGTSATSGYAPDGQSYSITSASGTSGQSSNFPTSFPVSGSPYTVTSGLAGDTWFVYNNAYVVIAQYSCLGGTSWQQTTVSGLTIANIDAGVITGGTIRASIGINAPIITGGTLQTSSGATQKIIISGTNDAIQFTDNTGTVVGNITPLNYSSIYGLVINAGSSPDSTGTGSNAGILVYNNAIEIHSNVGSLSSGGGFFANSLGASISGNGSIKMTGFASSGTSTPFAWLTQGALGNVYSSALTIQSDPGTTPTGGNAGDMWLYY